MLLMVAINYLSDPERYLHQKFEANLYEYTSYLVREIGNPPDYSRATDLGDQLGLSIQIISGEDTWQNDSFELPPHYLQELHEVALRPDMRIGHKRGYSFLERIDDNKKFYFVINHKRFTDNKVLFLVSVALIVVIVVGFSYLMVRWLFKPVRWLSQGVNEVAQGNFSVKVPQRKNDELGDLAEAFNRMSGQIDLMIKSKEQLLLDVSHELRSPLTRMKLALEFVDNNKSKKDLQNDVREMELMITELLESARLGSNQNKLNKLTTNLNELIRNMVLRYDTQEPGVMFHEASDEIYVDVDRERFEIVLRNLIDNAIKYSQDQTQDVEISLIKHENNIQMNIKDYGEGIPAEDLPHIFEPFYRVDKSRNTKTGGYGIGLSLCEKIVKAHAGTIKVSSQIGKGTLFIVDLPIDGYF